MVSGLALGCDAAAHRGCLDVKGGTIAIVGNGLDITHPRENKVLEDSILRNDGLMLSEQTIGVKANPTRLVARNRLQAALSEAVILAQCPAQSGSLHTMRFARKYGRESLQPLSGSAPRQIPATMTLLNRILQNRYDIPAMSGLRFNRPYPNTIKSVNLSACDIPRLRDLSYMFYGCWDLVAVDLFSSGCLRSYNHEVHVRGMSEPQIA